ncbi:MAG: YaaA family protein [Acidimicrobiales bacterium]
MPARTVILVPPSEAKAPDGAGPPWSEGSMSVGELDPFRRRLLDALGPGHPAASEPTMAAIERYCGVLYRELDAASLDVAGRRRLRRNLLTVSGLWGLVAPADPIPHYKLKMSASVADLGRLARWWKPQLTDALAPRVRGATVWDLLPIEHAAALDWTSLAPRRRVTVRFVDADGRTVSHWNKLLKGSIVRWLAESGTSDPRALVGFEHPLGYRLDERATSVVGREVALVFRPG